MPSRRQPVIPQNEFVLTWAMRVSHIDLAARLVAHAATKSTITTFRLVQKYTPSTKLRALPEEISSIIAGLVRNVAFEHERKHWVAVNLCFSNKCTMKDHILESEYDDVVERNSDDEDFIFEAEDDDYEMLEAKHRDHQWTLIHYCQVLTRLNGNLRIQKSAQIFIKDFGIYPRFNMTRNDSDGYYFNAVTVQAFLTLPPLFAVPIVSDFALNTASYIIHKQITNPAAWGELTAEQRLRFGAAVKVLDLRPYKDGDDEKASLQREFGGLPLADDVIEGETQVKAKAERVPAAQRSELPCGAKGAGRKDDDSKPQDGDVIIVKDGRDWALAVERGEKQAKADIEVAKGEEQQDWPQLIMLGCGEFETQRG
ncbi:hypothetical protein ACLMJK_009566 [Lecanora helva]